MDDIEGTIRAYGTIKRSIEKARAKRNFLVHLATYVIGNIFFGAWKRYPQKVCKQSGGVPSL